MGLSQRVTHFPREAADLSSFHNNPTGIVFLFHEDH